ncbi:MAG: HAD family phosphatase [Acetilactobacillus jinshanensis]
MNRKLIILDLDGTTLNSESKITPPTRKIVHEAAKQGNIVSIITGRPYRIAKPFYQQLGLKTPIICFNGGLGLIPGQNWPGTYQITFDRKIVHEIFIRQRELGINLMAAEDKLARETLNYFPSHLKSDQILTRDNLNFDPVCLAVQVQPFCLSLVTKYLKTHYKGIVKPAVWGGDLNVIEIAADNVTKVTGIKRLAQYYGIARKDIIAFGDQDNDYDSLKFVGHGVAMQNGLPDVKSVADDVTQYDNDHDGMARYLKPDRYAIPRAVTSLTTARLMGIPSRSA